MDDLCLYNKKKYDTEWKAREEEVKRRQDAEAVAKEAATSDEEEIIFEADPKQGAVAEKEATASINIHDIMNGSPTGGKDGDEELRSPAHKRGGLSKLLTRRSAHKVSPPEEEGTNKAITFSDEKVTHSHMHKSMVHKASITLKEDPPFDQFIKSLVSFISNA